MCKKHIFRDIARAGQNLKNVDQPKSYTTFREHLFRLFKKMVLDHKQFGFHNLRSRDARAMTNLRISNRQCISDKVVIGYLKSKGNVNQTK